MDDTRIVTLSETHTVRCGSTYTRVDRGGGEGVYVFVPKSHFFMSFKEAPAIINGTSVLVYFNRPFDWTRNLKDGGAIKVETL